MSSTDAGGAPPACRGAPHRGRVMASYRLYDARTTAYLGEFRDRGSAWAAADEHLIAEMLRRGTWVIGEYVVISASASAALDVDSQMTHLGPPDDIAECRRWLGSLPGRA
jgi:hypothetical protein